MRVPLWFDEGYAAWAAGEWERLGGARAQPRGRARGGARLSPDLDGALRGSASTADAAYALAVSAVTELARRNPTGRSTPLLAPAGTGEDFDAAVLATTGLPSAGSRRNGSGRVRRRYSLGTWLIAGGGWLVVALAGGGAGPAPAPRAIGPAGPRSTTDGTWSPKMRRDLNLTRPRNGGSLMPYAQFSPFGDLAGGGPRRAPLPARPDAIWSSSPRRWSVLVAGYVTLAGGASPAPAAALLVVGYCVLVPLGIAL